jgi:putative membrane protein
MMGFGWILLLVTALLFSRLLFPRGKESSTGDPDVSPVDIAKSRYAKGEINKEEFERIKRGLQGGST